MRSIIKKIESPKTLIIASLILGLFITYPNTATIFHHAEAWVENNVVWQNIAYWTFRYLIFVLLFTYLLWMNIRQCMFAKRFSVRLLKSAGVTAIFYGIYVIISLLINTHPDCFQGVVIFQFLMTCLICVVTGHFYSMYEEKDKIQKEMELLKLENLQSRYEALNNQINPHFFFNSLNGLTALVRNDDKVGTLEYISNMSSVFRYILQSEQRSIVTLTEELTFLDSFVYLQQIRYADKLSFIVNIPEGKKNMRLPALSLLPLIENVVKHNMIDSENPMTIKITVTADNELLVLNPIHEKIDKPEKSGIGLKNLISRFDLLSGAKVKVSIENNFFHVYLPLMQQS